MVSSSWDMMQKCRQGGKGFSTLLFHDWIEFEFFSSTGTLPRLLKSNGVFILFITYLEMGSFCNPDKVSL